MPFWLLILKWYETPHDKTNKMTVRPAKIQISLGICPVWSESSLCTQWVAKDPSFLHADSGLWSDWADAQADLSLHWEHMPLVVGFVMMRFILTCWNSSETPGLLVVLINGKAKINIYPYIVIIFSLTVQQTFWKSEIKKSLCPKIHVILNRILVGFSISQYTQVYWVWGQREIIQSLKH